MAGEAGQPSEPLNLLAGMAAAPWDYDFFQALRRIECESPQLPRLGHSVRLADDPLRLGQKPDCTFAPCPCEQYGIDCPIVSCPSDLCDDGVTAYGCTGECYFDASDGSCSGVTPMDVCFE